MKGKIFLAFRLKEFLIGFSAVAVCVLCVVLLDFNSLVNTVSDNVNNGTDTLKVIIDPGHGDFDGGTQSASGVIEKNINLQISLKLRDVLTLMGYEIIMTRDSDIALSDEDATTIRQKKSTDLNNRLKIINDNPDYIFVSIHQNYYAESKYSGTQVFYSKNNPESQKLAHFIQQSVATKLQKENQRQIKQSGKEIYVLDQASSPAVMVECGFLSNVAETELLSDEDYQKKLVLTIADGINNYINNKE